MFVKQISIFIENKTGRLATIIETLGKNNIDICALSIADTTDFGILRVIVNKPDLAIEVLREIGVTAKSTNVLAVSVDDTPGGLSKVLNIINSDGLSIEYMYAFVGRTAGKAWVVMRVDAPEKAIKLLAEHGVSFVDSTEIYG